MLRIYEHEIDSHRGTDLISSAAMFCKVLKGIHSPATFHCTQERHSGHVLQLLATIFFISGSIGGHI